MIKEEKSSACSPFVVESPRDVHADRNRLFTMYPSSFEAVVL